MPPREGCARGGDRRDGRSGCKAACWWVEFDEAFMLSAAWGGALLQRSCLGLPRSTRCGARGRATGQNGREAEPMVFYDREIDT